MNSFIKKAVTAVFTLFLIVSFTFLLLFLIPGDPVDFILKDGVSLEDKNLLRQEMGLDKSFTVQYIQFFKNVITLNLGQSVHTGEPVLNSIARQFPFTFFLSLMSLSLALLWGISIGVLSAHPQFKKLEKFFNFFPLIFFSVPVFVSAPLLIWLFSNQLAWLPVSGAGSFSYLLLPSLSLALPLGAVLMKITRASILEVLSSDYVRTAQSKGLSLSQIYFKHVLKNALIPI
ncbi:MAG: ABC transporter permease, partial [Oligoflexia bacterium]|nr:ABC transporter permease [Oligoflexia bacterium]